MFRAAAGGGQRHTMSAPSAPTDTMCFRSKLIRACVTLPLCAWLTAWHLQPEGWSAASGWSSSNADRPTTSCASVTTRGPCITKHMHACMHMHLLTAKLSACCRRPQPARASSRLPRRRPLSIATPPHLPSSTPHTLTSLSLAPLTISLPSLSSARQLMLSPCTQSVHVQGPACCLASGTSMACHAVRIWQPPTRFSSCAGRQDGEASPAVPAGCRVPPCTLPHPTLLTCVASMRSRASPLRAFQYVTRLSVEVVSTSLASPGLNRTALKNCSQKGLMHM